jgi:hypothetical protein
LGERMLDLDQGPNGDEAARAGWRRLDVEHEALAGGQTLEPPVRAVADNRPKTGNSSIRSRRSSRRATTSCGWAEQGCRPAMTAHLSRTAGPKGSFVLTSAPSDNLGAAR